MLVSENGRVVAPRVESSPPPTVFASFSLMEVAQRPPSEGLMLITVITTPDATLLDNLEIDLGVSRGHDEDQVDEATLGQRVRKQCNSCIVSGRSCFSQCRGIHCPSQRFRFG